MSITFERSEDELLLILTPERIDIQDILEILRKDEEWHISRTFTVNINRKIISRLFIRLLSMIIQYTNAIRTYLRYLIKISFICLA